MSLKKALPWLIVLAIVGFIAWKLHTSHFDYAGFLASLREVNLPLLGVATLLIYSNSIIRALRWAIMLRPAMRQPGVPHTPWYALIGSQFIGFTGLSIFGRIGELIRPLLVSRRTGLTFPSQVAVVTVERIFDLGAFGLIFAVNLLLSPTLQSLPYLHKAGNTIGALTVIIVVFVLSVRLAGAAVARITGTLVGLISKPAGTFCSAKILEFRSGLNVIGSFADFAAVAALSLVLWATIALAYLCTLRAFPPPVQTLTLGHTIILLAFSIAGSALPIPGGGGAWAGNVFALSNLFAIPAALAASAGLVVWLISNMTIIPIGLIFAKVEGISLKQLANTSEQAEAEALTP